MSREVIVETRKLTKIYRVLLGSPEEDRPFAAAERGNL
jgi:hypothetical protein